MQNFNKLCINVANNNCYSQKIELPLFSSRNAKQMPTSVCDALKEAFQKEGGRSESQAQEMLDDMEKVMRFQSETWS